MLLGIYGAGGLGREVLELANTINERCNNWEKIIFIVDGSHGEEVNGCQVYSYDDAINSFQGRLEMTIGIGEPSVRERLFAKIEADGIEAVTLIHPDSYIPTSTTVGKGVTIQFGTFVSCNTVVEDYVYIQPNVNIGHDVVLHRGSMVSGLCNIAGHVTIGESTYLGLSSCFKEGVSIGKYSIIGMGSVVHKDIPDEVIAMGNPARPMAKNEEHRVFK